MLGSASPSGCSEHSAGRLGGAVDLLQVDAERRGRSGTCRARAARRRCSTSARGAGRAGRAPGRRRGPRRAARRSRRPAGDRLAVAPCSISAALGHARGNTRTRRASAGEASAALTCIAVSMFSQMRGGASTASGPSSRRSRCTRLRPLRAIAGERRPAGAAPARRANRRPTPSADRTASCRRGADVLGRDEALGRRRSCCAWRQHHALRACRSCPRCRRSAPDRRRAGPGELGLEDSRGWPRRTARPASCTLVERAAGSDRRSCAGRADRRRRAAQVRQLVLAATGSCRPAPGPRRR